MAPELPSRDAAAAETGVIDDHWVRQHYGRIHRAAWYLTGDRSEAEDLAQETFIVAIEQWERFDRRSSEQTWLYGILIRLDLRRRRTFTRARRRLLHYLDRSRVVDPQREDPQMQIAEQQWRDSIWADVARLSADQRNALVLRFAEEMSYEEMAESLGCPVGTAKSRVHHGLKKLRQQIDLSLLTESPFRGLQAQDKSNPLLPFNAR